MTFALVLVVAGLGQELPPPPARDEQRNAMTAWMSALVPEELYTASGIAAGDGLTLEVHVRRAGGVSLSLAAERVSVRLPVHVDARVDKAYTLGPFELKHHEDASTDVDVEFQMTESPSNAIDLTVTASWSWIRPPTVRVFGVDLDISPWASAWIDGALVQLASAVEAKVESMLAPGSLPP